MTDTVILFLSLLTVLCQVFVVSIVLLRVFAKSRYETVADALGPLTLGLAFSVAAVTMLGSLYMSEIAHFTPCRFCWYQRIALYPIALILGVALLRREPSIWPYVIALAVVDIPISAYHYLIEWYPNLETTSCDPANPCSLVWFRELGYITLPLMALTSAVTLITLMLLTRRTLSTWPNPNSPSNT